MAYQPLQVADPAQLLERVTGIEPAWPAWKFEIEPLRAFYCVSLYPNAVTLLSGSFQIVPAVSRRTGTRMARHARCDHAHRHCRSAALMGAFCGRTL